MLQDNRNYEDNGDRMYGIAQHFQDDDRTIDEITRDARECLEKHKNDPKPEGTCSECAFGHWFGNSLFCDFNYTKGDIVPPHGVNPNGWCGMFQRIDDNFEEDKIVITLPATDTYGKYHIDPLSPKGRGLAYLKEDLSYILGCGQNDIKVEFKSKRNKK